MIERLTRQKAIKEKCLDCCCGQKNEVRLCPSKKCPLWPFRRGKEDISEYSPEIIRAIEETRKKQAETCVFQGENEDEEES